LIAPEAIGVRRSRHIGMPMDEAPAVQPSLRATGFRCVRDDVVRPSPAERRSKLYGRLRLIETPSE